jgi:hypothetical protein
MRMMRGEEEEEGMMRRVDRVVEVGGAGVRVDRGEVEAGVRAVVVVGE